MQLQSPLLLMERSVTVGHVPFQAEIKFMNDDTASQSRRRSESIH